MLTFKSNATLSAGIEKIKSLRGGAFVSADPGPSSENKYNRIGCQCAFKVNDEDESEGFGDKETRMLNGKMELS